MIYYEESGGFQFLIGRLVTESGEKALAEKERFQFLIGRLVTPCFPVYPFMN